VNGLWPRGGEDDAVFNAQRPVGDIDGAVGFSQLTDDQDIHPRVAQQIRDMGISPFFQFADAVDFVNDFFQGFPGDKAVGPAALTGQFRQQPGIELACHGRADGFFPVSERGHGDARLAVPSESRNILDASGSDTRNYFLRECTEYGSCAARRAVQ